MKIVISPEGDESFTEEIHTGVTDYFYAVRGHDEMGLPYRPRDGYRGEYAFLLGWIEILKLVISREVLSQ